MCKIELNASQVHTGDEVDWDFERRTVERRIVLGCGSIRMYLTNETGYVVEDFRANEKLIVYHDPENVV